MRLKEIRDSLLGLHSYLLEYQKAKYEKDFEVITNSAQFFKLVTTHPDFVWLRTLSEIIVSIDELLEKEPVDHKAEEDLVQYLRKVVESPGLGGVFESKYIKAIAEDGAVAVAHGSLVSLLKSVALDK